MASECTAWKTKAIEGLNKDHDKILPVAKLLFSTWIYLLQTRSSDKCITNIATDDFQIVAMSNHIKEADTNAFDHGGLGVDTPRGDQMPSIY